MSKNQKTPDFRGKDNKKWIKTAIKEPEMWNFFNFNTFWMELFNLRYQMYLHEKTISFYDLSKMLNFAPAKVYCGQIIRDF